MTTVKKPKPKYGIRRLVLDVMKPHKPSLVEFAQGLSTVNGVQGVNCMLDEIDQETETLKIILEGIDIEFDAVDEEIRAMGGVIHSIDSVVVGSKLVEDVETPQD